MNMYKPTVYLYLLITLLFYLSVLLWYYRLTLF